ncbi:MAG: plasmid replication protein, partial [Geminicoccaceae bacterium]|nr:plasmid replication protein [Geminicoccaceae bacterium]
SQQALAYRLHALGKPTSIGWGSLHGQFGAGFKLARQFKPHFVEALGHVAKGG